MTEQTTQRAPPEGSVPEDELNHRVNNEVAAAVSVEAIAKAAATGKPALYGHFVSKDELVVEYLRESAKRLDAC